MRRRETVARLAVAADLDAAVARDGAPVGAEAVASWTLPEEQRRARLPATAGFVAYIDGLIASGAVVVGACDGIAGCSVWLDIDEPAAEEPADDAVLALLKDVYGEYLSRVHHVAELTRQHRPTGKAYRYLQQMAVRPDRRGLGVGGAMLRYGLAVADDRWLPVYLEASSQRNRALYLRHGFNDIGDPIDLPDDGPTLYPMRREPRTERPAPSSTPG